MSAKKFPSRVVEGAEGTRATVDVLESFEGEIYVETRDAGYGIIAEFTPAQARRLAHDLLAAALVSERAKGLRP